MSMFKNMCDLPFQCGASKLNYRVSAENNKDVVNMHRVALRLNKFQITSDTYGAI